ncbi:MAG: flagellin [Clostridiales bacterium]|nr:flagellin [Clostridiales bacterium]
MIISRNLDAMNLNRIVNDNISAHAKSSERVSSGYRINLAADNPVGLAMSETMRRQIRGLMQGTNNTKDGVAFVQIADGAMSEIHDMLQRMNELSLKSADGLCTAVDRAALNAEFDQLRTEIDRINSNTSFNTMPVFEEHEPSYYQICGNRQWNDNQLHTITESTNELNIHLPDGYVPKDYTITVPAGTYTTQELMDEIDDALHKMSPANPGFVFEYTSDGYCNLNFESADGKPTMIDFIDGSLSYLIYDFETGGSAATLLGTTGFGPGETLSISRGNNDVLGFYLERDGISQEVSITLAPKSYTYDDLFNAIQSELNNAATKASLAADVKVETYEDDGKRYVQITGTNNVNITGLKGNMFRFEKSGQIYHSAFYDNAIYGEFKNTPASITGNYYDSSYPIGISDNNNILKFKVNNKEYEIKIPVKANGDGYTVSQLVSLINSNADVKDVVTASSVSKYISGRNDYCYALKLSGTQGALVFDTDSDVNKNTYNTLFCTDGDFSTIITGQPASITGTANLTGKISLPDEPLIFYVDGTKCTLTGIGGDYNSLEDLCTKLNGIIPDDIKTKIKFDKDSSNHIRIVAQSSAVKKIEIKDKNNTYNTLFTQKRYTYYTSSYSGRLYTTGSTQQGNLSSEEKYEAATYRKYDSTSDFQKPIDLSGNNTMTINLSKGSPITITLNEKYDTIGQLVNDINSKLGSASSEVSVSYTSSSSSGSINFNYSPDRSKVKVGDNWSISVNFNWDAIFKTSVQGHSSSNQSDSTITSFSTISNGIKIDDSNNVLELKLNGMTNAGIVTIKNGTYNTKEALAKAVQDAINATNDLKDKGITVSCENSKLVLTAPYGTFTSNSVKGSFYYKVMCEIKDLSPDISAGGSKYDPPARIIGRVDLTKEPLEIIKGANDQITFDFTYPGSTDPLVITITLPAGEYQDGIALFGDKNNPNQDLIDEIKRQIDDYDSSVPNCDEIKRLFGTGGIFDLNFTIGGESTGAANSVDSSALQISATLRDETNVPPLSAGQYIIDGVRGSAAPFVFYKTTSLPIPSYIIGTKNVMDGVTIESGKNILTLSSNNIPFQYTFPEDTFYTADELIDKLNDMFENGDDYGNPAPLEAALENGAVKISYKLLGSNKITNVGGSARSTIFFEEEGRDSRDPLILQVGAEQRSTIELPRISVSSCSLGINSLTISQMKYADKAIERIKEAIHKLNAKRSTYGAMQNRLEHTINNNENITENVQDTESEIRDTDIASEMIRYSNLSILLKAGQSMIAQSNQRIEKLLTILQ